LFGNNSTNTKTIGDAEALVAVKSTAGSRRAKASKVEPKLKDGLEKPKMEMWVELEVVS
jgi:hypothetical protein